MIPEPHDDALPGNRAGTIEGASPRRRLHKRYNIYLPLRFSARGLEGEDIGGSGITINIGGGGAFFSCRTKKLKPGMRLRVEISIESALIRGESITLTASVLRVVPLGAETLEESADVGVAIKFDQAWKSIAILAPG